MDRTVRVQRRLTLALGGLVAMAVVAGSLVSPLGVAAATHRGAAQPANQDWPTFLHDNARSGASTESILNTTNAATLGLKWTYPTGSDITDSAAIVNGVVYVGSWDGYEYALNATTGALIWKTNLGQTTDPNCVFPVTAGITSAAAVVNGVVYVGGGGPNWYALNASNGAVLWSVPTGDNSPAGGHYNWSSPLIYNGYAYIGIASNCDNPLVQGELMQVNLTTHQVTNVAKFVPDGQVGGGIWTSPTIDTATNTIFVSTGTINMYTQQYSQAVVSLDATTLQIKDHWQLPFEVETYDSDWGTTPTLTTDANGDQLLSLANKNGVLYTFNRNNLAAGPIWQVQLAPGGACPTCGDGTISSGNFVPSLTVHTTGGGTYTGPVLFYANGNTVLNGTGHQGVVRAFNPANGAVLWTHPTDGAIVGALAYDNGLIMDPQHSEFELLDATTGYSVYDYKLTTTLYGAAAFSEGQVYIGGADGKEYVFGLPATPPPAPPADPNCPAGFTCQDIGNPGHAGSEKTSNGQEIVTASGIGLRHSSDQFRLISEPVTGDSQISVDDISQTGGAYPGWDAPQLGIIYRQSADPLSPYYAALQDPTYPNENERVANLIMFYRDTYGGPTVELTQEFPAGFPRRVIVQRRGDVFQTLVSSTTTGNANYFLIPGTERDIVMPTTLMGGMAVAAGSSSSVTTATYQGFAVGAPTAAYGYLNTTHACPAPWQCHDVDDPNPPGDQILSNGQWTLEGAGWGIGSLANYSYEDSFHYVYQSLSNDQTISAQFTGFASGAPAKAQSGLMMRASMDQHSPYYGIFVYPNGTGIVQWRTQSDIIDRVDVPLPTLSSPLYLQVSRYTNKSYSPPVTFYSAATSTDGTHWTPVDGSTVAIDMGGGAAGPTLVGMASDAIAANTQVASYMQNVSITPTTASPPGVCDTADGYTCTDIGQGHVPGNQTYLQPTWNIQGSGDLYDVYDQFRYVSQALPGDGTVTARVVSQSQGGEWQKSGVMIRSGSNDPQAPYYGVFLTPQHGVMVSWRPSEAATTFTDVPNDGLTAPTYLMAARYTDPNHANTVYYAAYTSTDNHTWTVVPNSVMTLNIPGPLTAGMAATSYTTYTATSVFDNFAILGSAPAPPGICPAVWTCADVDNSLPPGTQTLSGSTWSMNVGGSDIWSTADQFHFMYQNLAADGTVSAHIDGVSGAGAGPWAKDGVMLRSTTDPGSPYYAIFATNGNGLAVQWRPTQGASTNQILVNASTPVYLMVNRWTDTGANPAVTYYQALTSSDGSTWTAVPGSLVTIPAMSGTLLAGIAADSFNQNQLATWTMDTLSVQSTEVQPYGICPGGWTCEDVNPAVPAGAQNDASGTWTVQGDGYDIWNTSDQFHFAGQTLAADGTVSAHLTAQTNTSPWAKAGLMLRASNDPGSPYYGIFMTPGNGVAVQYRTAQGGQTNQVQLAGMLPTYFELVRYTDSSGASPITYYAAYTSSNGSTWTEVPNSAVAMSMPGTLLAGMAVTSHNLGTLGTATFDTVTFTTSEVVPGGICPGSMTCADIGGSLPAGTQTIAGTSWSVSGGGADIWAASDQFRFAGSSTSGDGTFSANVASQTNSNAWAKAGVMMRGSTDPAAPYYAALLTPTNGLAIQWRTAQGGNTSQVLVAGAAPQYLRVARWTDTSGASPITYYAAYTSPDGSTWTAVPGSTVSLTLPSLYLEGVAVTSHNTSQLSTASFINVAAGTSSTEPPGVCSANWTCADIGGAQPGTQTQNGATFTVQGGGSDIWAASDQFRLLSQALAGDGTSTAKVASVTSTSGWAKAGLMFRLSSDPGSPYYAILVTPSNGIVVQYRTAQGATTSQVVAAATGAPVYIRITRTGTTYVAATSPDGVTWTTVSSSSIAIPALTGTLLSGLAVCSHDPANLATAVFQNVANA